MYDNICKFIAETFSQDLSQWLLGKSIPLTLLEPTELQLDPIRADSVIFLESEDLILHIEFQTSPDENIPFRMADYRLRLYRRFPNKTVIQIVIYLRKNNSDLTKIDRFELPNFYSQYQVIRLWEIPTEQLLTSSGLLPFAVLSQTDNPVKTLEKVAQKIEEIADKKEKSNVAATTAILAGLICDKIIIRRLLREEIMKESVIYQDIQETSEAKGIQKGEAKLVIRLINRRIGEISPNLNQIIRELTVEQLENLGEALLDFENERDLIHWLDHNG